MTLLVIDIGSSSIRAALMDAEARLIAGTLVSRPHQFTTYPAGTSTIDADSVRHDVEACVDSLMQHPLAGAVTAVGVAMFVGNVLGVDSAGSPVTPVFTYADTRCTTEVAALREQVDAVQAHQRTGCPLHTAYLPARLTWLRHMPTAPVARWVDVSTYLYGHWFGRDVPCSYSVASWSGLLSREGLVWDETWLSQLGLQSEHLPPLADFDSVQTGLTSDYATRWPPLRGVPFFLAVGDGAAANIGSGCLAADRVALTVGTTAALRIVTEHPPALLPSGLWDYRVDRQRHLIGGATSEGGSIFQWAQATLNLHPWDKIDAALSERIPDQHGLTVLPLFAGERSPGWRSEATGAVVGLRLSTTPLDLLQALLEGVGLRLALILEQMAAEISPGAVVIGGGGALRASPAWTQIIANALNTPIYVADEPEITLRGVAHLLLASLNSTPLPNPEVSVAGVFEPQPAAVERLQAARLRQETLYRNLLVYP